MAGYVICSLEVFVRGNGAAVSFFAAKGVLEMAGNITMESDVLIGQWVRLYFNGGLSIFVMFVAGNTIGRSCCFLYNGRNGRLCLKCTRSDLVVLMCPLLWLADRPL
jgi:hypothetical protein